MEDEACRVCRGARRITLPLHPRSVVLAHESTEPAPYEAHYREYPCPECCGGVDVDRVGVVRHLSMIDSFAAVDDGRETTLMDHVRRGSAHDIGRLLHEKGLIRFETRHGDASGFRTSLSATVAVVAPSRVDDLEEKLAWPLVEEVLDVAAKSIHNWGSYYGRHTIEKDRAAYFLDNALRTVKNRREKKA